MPDDYYTDSKPVEGLGQFADNDPYGSSERVLFRAYLAHVEARLESVCLDDHLPEDLRERLRNIQEGCRRYRTGRCA